MSGFNMESQDAQRRFAIPLRIARQLMSQESEQRLTGLRRLQEDILALDLFWGFSSLLPEVEKQPWEPDREEVLEPLRVIAAGKSHLQTLRDDPDKRIARRAVELCELIETWEMIEKGEIEPPFLTRFFVPVRVSTLGGLALVRRRSWFFRLWIRLLGG